MNKKKLIIPIIILVVTLPILFIKPKEDKVPVIISEFLIDKEINYAGNEVQIKQAKIDEEISKYINDQKYTFDNPKVLQNPYEISPLTALIVFNTKKESIIDVYINGKKVTTMESSKKHLIPIYGLLEDQKNIIELKENNKTKKIEIVTEPSNKPLLEVKTNKVDNELYFLSSSERVFQSAYDNNGNLRWYLKTLYGQDIEFLENGNILIPKDDVYYNGGSVSGFYEINYLGKIIHTYEIAGGYHHELFELSNGNILVSSSNTNTTRNYDYFLELERNTGKVLDQIDLNEIIKKVDKDFDSTLSNNWANSTSIYLKDNELIIGINGLNSVININKDTKKINWIFGDPKYWSNKFDQYLLKTVDNFNYPQGIHTAKLTNDGNLTIFNNNFDYKNYNLSSYKNTSSSSIIYQIKDNSIEEIWTYQDKSFSHNDSSFEVIDNNKLITYGWIFTEEAFNNNMSMGNANTPHYSKIIELNSKDEIIFEGILPYGNKQVYKSSLYKNITKNINLDKFTTSNTLSETKLEKINVDNIKESLRNAPFEGDTFHLSHNDLKLNYFIQDSDEIKILFISNDEDGYLMNYKEVNENPIDKMNLTIRGDYAVYLIINGMYYSTNQVIRL